MGFASNVFCSQAFCTVTRLRIPDHLKQGPMTVPELATAMNIKHQSSLLQTMRLLSTKEAGCFKENNNGTFENTEFSKLFIGSDSKEYHFTQMLWGNNAWKSFTRLDAAFDGKIPYEVANGKSYWDLIKDGEEKHFVKFMSGFTVEMYSTILNFKFSRFKHIVDVGGLKGSLLQAIQKEYPSIKEFTLFDQPHVVPKSLEGIRTVGGDFLSVPTQIPRGADCYILKNVIHNWNDEQSVHILKNVHGAMPDDGRVLLIEQILPPLGDDSDMFGKAIGFMMTVLLGGQERTLEEYKVLFNKAGLEFVTVHGEKSGLYGVRIVEVKKKGK